MSLVKASGPISLLLNTTKQACDVLSPLVRRLYVYNANASLNVAAKEQSSLKIQSSNQVKTLKADLSVFTIADGLVQELLKTHLFKNGAPFEEIVGEEDSSVINILKRPYKVDALDVPSEFFDEIDYVRKKVETLSEQISVDEYADIYKTLTLFIDPIDGTREFASGLGEQCTILVGIVKTGAPIGGLIYRPIPTSPSWALGCKEEKYVAGMLDTDQNIKTTSNSVRVTDKDGFVTTNGSISTFTEKLIEKLGMHRVRAGGVGNKVMNLLENKGKCYIQDRGVSRWDTAGPQAVLEAYGGHLSKLVSVVAEGKLDSYRYRKISTEELNCDTEILDILGGRFSPLFARPNIKNCASSDLIGKPMTNDTRQFIKPYANICGLFAVGPKTSTSAADPLQQYIDTVIEVASEQLPTFS